MRETVHEVDRLRREQWRQVLAHVHRHQPGRDLCEKGGSGETFYGRDTKRGAEYLSGEEYARYPLIVRNRTGLFVGRPSSVRSNLNIV